MASSNKTPNLELPQWELSDKPEMADFNDANEKIDTVVSSHLAESIQQNEVHGVKLADYVMERGSNYEKWYSGKFIQWGKYNGSEELTNAFGALYRSPNVRRINFPLAFFDKPDVFLESQTHQLLDVYLNDVSSVSFGFRGIYVYSQTNIIEFAWRAIGTWK